MSTSSEHRQQQAIKGRKPYKPPGVPATLGWCSQQKREFLENWIATNQTRRILEIGVYGGASLIPMAIASLPFKGSKVVGIDPWSLGECLKGMTDEADLEWWHTQNRLSDAENGCRAAIKALKLTNVELWKGTSDEFISQVTDKDLDLLHIDGNHGRQALIDARNYLPKVRLHGLIAMDDEDWTDAGEPFVQQAIDWLLENGCRQLPSITNCAFLIRDREIKGDTTAQES